MKFRPRRLWPSFPAAIIWLRPTAIMTKMSRMLHTVRDLGPTTFSMMPGMVTSPYLRYFSAKNSPIMSMPTPFAMVYHQPEMPEVKPYSEQPVVAVPPSHCPQATHTMANTPIPAPTKESEDFVFREARMPMAMVRAKYRMMMISCQFIGPLLSDMRLRWRPHRRQSPCGRN